MLGLARRGPLLGMVLAAVLVGTLMARKEPPGGRNFSPGVRVIRDAHNCYPYDGKYADRIERALATGTPVSIEIDVAWHAGPGEARPVISHSTKTTGAEPGLEAYFFERVRPLVEKALSEGNTAAWPVLYLHFEFKTNEREHAEAVAKILAKYRPWLSSSVRVADESKRQPIRMRPVLVITEAGEMQKRVFHDEVRPGERFYVFGSAPGNEYFSREEPRERQLERMAGAPPGEMLSEPAGNYRRWWNNSWAVVERGGPSLAGDWTPADQRRLTALVAHAHRLGYLIRFYTLNGHPPNPGEDWLPGYNFGGLDAVRARWKAAHDAAVDFIASDQYEDLAATLAQYSLPAERRQGTQ